MKLQKGEYGFIQSRRKIEILKTVLMFALSLAVFLIGYSVTKTRANLFTVVAVLGMLPASKCAVSMIMFLKSSTGTREAYEEIAAHMDGMPAVYDLVITTAERAYPVLAIACGGQALYGFVEKKGKDLKKLEQHLSQMLKQNQHSSVHVKLFEDISLYTASLDSLNEKRKQGLWESTEETEEIMALMLALSI